jgi:hypothetical protein
MKRDPTITKQTNHEELKREREEMEKKQKRKKQR